ncbi:non-functional pseudokinase ZED1-like [Castanea sativa]|uniref:non-functional pseudokinase ZED1-like n=1 Tax=Castanea sativa TaxID=21020 RepID=UPI003F65099C
MLQCFRERKKAIAQTEESFYLENGGLMLEQLITSFDGKHNSFRIFSKQELEKATNDYHVDGILYKSFQYIAYRGTHDGREIFVKKFTSSSLQTYKTLGCTDTPFLASCRCPTRIGHRNRYDSPDSVSVSCPCPCPCPCIIDKTWCINEIAVVSQMNNHNNVVKFFGCCLETEIPTLVYEFVENGNLSDHIFDDRRLLTWESRLRIVTEVAHAIAYVHMGRPKTIVHRDIESRNIFLDQNYVAKIAEFGFSLPIPLDKKYVDAEVVGAVGFISPESHYTGRYREKSDVYSFGAVLFEVLTGKRSWNILHNEFEVPEENCRGESSLVGVQRCSWDEIESNIQSYLKANLLDGGNRKQQIECAELAQRCLKMNSDERPTMKEVTQSLRDIKRLLDTPT